jgi:signal transduction histidine kinase
VDDGKDRITLSVKDDGPGIAPEYHERVFRLFHTLRPRDEVEGSGMGLAIVKKLVEAHGGEIRLHSDVGQGANFQFTWPKQWPKAQDGRR